MGLSWGPCWARRPMSHMAQSGRDSRSSGRLSGAGTSRPVSQVAVLTMPWWRRARGSSGVLGLSKAGVREGGELGLDSDPRLQQTQLKEQTLREEAVNLFTGMRQHPQGMSPRKALKTREIAGKWHSGHWCLSDSDRVLKVNQRHQHQATFNVRGHVLRSGSPCVCTQLDVLRKLLNRRGVLSHPGPHSVEELEGVFLSPAEVAAG